MVLDLALENKISYDFRSRYSLDIQLVLKDAFNYFESLETNDRYLSEIIEDISEKVAPYNISELFYSVNDLQDFCDRVVADEFCETPAETLIQNYRNFKLVDLLRKGYRRLIIDEMFDNIGNLIYNRCVENLNKMICNAEITSEQLNFTTVDIVSQFEWPVSSRFCTISDNHERRQRLGDIDRKCKTVIREVLEEARKAETEELKYLKSLEQEQEIITAEIVEVSEKINNELVIDVIPVTETPALEAPKTKAPKRKRKNLQIDVNSKVFKAALDNIRTLLDRKTAMYEMEFVTG